MTDTADDGVWRDEKRLPLEELSRAMATNSADGQVDDTTGNDAGYQAAFGDGSVVERASRDDAGSGAGDPDPDSEEGRALRPSPLGRQGPH
ncbi:MAG TPA: hypothetical protein VK453_27105 [Micromonosporaceae bacterium]|nr:hypothetical protein [Micromonosporaceae bacterium]